MGRRIKQAIASTLTALALAGPAYGATNNIFECWLSSADIGSPGWDQPVHTFEPGSTNYFYTALDTTFSPTVKIGSVSYSLQSLGGVSFLTNSFPIGNTNFAFNGVSLNNSTTKIGQNTNSSGVLDTNNIAAASGSWVSNLTVNFSSTTQRRGLLAKYQIVMPTTFGASGDFTPGSVQVKNNIGTVVMNTTIGNIEYNDGGNWAVAPEPSEYVLFVTGGAILFGAGRRLRSRSKLEEGVGVGGSSGSGPDPRYSAYHGLPIWKQGRGRMRYR